MGGTQRLSIMLRVRSSPCRVLVERGARSMQKLSERRIALSVDRRCLSEQTNDDFPPHPSPAGPLTDGRRQYASLEAFTGAVITLLYARQVAPASLLSKPQLRPASEGQHLLQARLSF